jgi:hypothetical protein
MGKRRTAVAVNRATIISKIVCGILTVISVIGAYTCVVFLVISLFNDNIDVAICACGGIALSIFMFIRSYGNRNDSDTG